MRGIIYFVGFFVLISGSRSLTAATGGNVTVKMEKGSVAQGTTPAEALLGPHIKIETTIENGSAAPVSFVAVEIGAYDAEDKPVSINSAKSALSALDKTDAAKLPYQTDDSVVQIVQLPSPLAPKQTTSVTLTVSGGRLSPLPADKIEKLGVQAVGAGDMEYAKSLLGSVLIPPSERERLAGVVSRAKGARYYYVTDDGQWKLPDGLANLPIAKVSDQISKDSVKFERSRGKRGVVEVEVRNAADRTISIHILGNGVSQNLAIDAGKTQRIQIPGGLFSFTATASRCVPLSGQENWEEGSAYTWTFSIR